VSVGGDSIGNRIARLRANAGLSQERFAEMIDKSRNCVIKIENNENIPKADTLMRICRVLNVSADFLLFGETEQEPESYDALIQRANRLDGELKKQFYESASILLTGFETLQMSQRENAN
jgi:transcriptional regulator with XRE-family HTH domain